MPNVRIICLRLVLLVTILVGLASVLFFYQRQLVFPYHAISAPIEQSLADSSAEKLWIESASARVEAWYFPPLPEKGTPNPHPVVIYAHANMELIDHAPMEFKLFPQNGIGLLLVEYPGYGRSTGIPSQSTITELFCLAYDWIASRKEVDPNRVVAFGRSLGGGVACALSARKPIAALVLLSTFTDIRSWPSPLFSAFLPVLDSFDNLSVLRRFQNPVLILHGNSDSVFPISNAVNLKAAAKNSRMIVYDAGHDDCPPKWNEGIQTIVSFLGQHAVLP